MTYQLGISLNTYTLQIKADDVTASAVFTSGSNPAASTVGRALMTAADTNTARITLERQDFATRADFVAWATGRTPTVGLVMRAAGVAYRYTGVDTGLADLPGWAMEAPYRRSGHAAYDPTFAHTLISGGDGNYRHESSVCQSADGKLHAFWAGNPAATTESASGQVIYHATSADGGTTWSTATAVYLESATNTLTPTATQSVARCEAVGTEVWLFFGNRGTSSQEALIWGRLTQAGVWTWRRLLINTTTQAPSWSATDLTGTPAAGSSLYWTIEGDVCSVTPTSVLVRPDGGVDLLLVAVTSFGVIHHMFLTRLSSTGAFTLIGSPIPSGPDLVPVLWEGSLIALPEGGYVVFARRLTTYAGQTTPLVSGTRHVIAESPDGMGWTAAEVTGLRTHSSKSAIAPLSSSRWVIAANASWTERNDVSVGISSDPRAFVLGPLASNEDITTNYAEYPDVLVYTYGGVQHVGLTYSGRLQSAAAPNEIRWSSCLLPADGVFSGQTTPQRANRSDAAAVSTAAGQIITIPPHASFSWEPTPYGVERRSIRWRVDALPTGVSYIIAAVGNNLTRSQLYLSSVNGGYVLRLNGRTVGMPITDPTQWQTAVVEIDKRNGVARMMGNVVALPHGPITITSGDAFDSTGFSSGTTGNLLLDMAACTATEGERFATASVSSLEGGPNRFANPEFSIDQRNQGATLGNGVGDKLDMVYLADNGGCGLSISQGSFSDSAAPTFFDGVKSHIRMARTSAGSTPPQFDFYLGDVGALAGQQAMVEFSAYDAANIAYPLELWMVHNFGTGGSATFSQRLGVVDIDGFSGRRFAVDVFWPTISSSSTVGTDAFCALQLRPWYHALGSNADLRFGNLDVHAGMLKRPFQRVPQSDILANCKQYFQSIRAVEAFGNFGTACAVTTTAARMPLVRAPMRKTPTMTVSAAGDFTLVGNTSNVATAISAARNTETETEINFTVASGLTAWANYQARDTGSGVAALYLTARYR